MSILKQVLLREVGFPRCVRSIVTHTATAGAAEQKCLTMVLKSHHLWPIYFVYSEDIHTRDRNNEGQQL